MGSDVTDIAQALQRFFGRFGLSAYGKNDVPDGAEGPYITYEIACPAPFKRAPLKAWVWSRGGDLTGAFEVCDRMRGALAEGGAAVGGAHIFAENPFIQEEGRGDMRSVAVRVSVLAMPEEPEETEETEETDETEQYL